eukprot:jgi/Tetstr1/461372/TSEL_006495.t1
MLAPPPLRRCPSRSASRADGGVVCGRRRAIDHRAPHRLSPNKPYLPEELARLGVLMWKLDPAARKTDPKLAAILKPSIRSTSIDEAIRYCDDSGGHFDWRDAADRGTWFGRPSTGRATTTRRAAATWPMCCSRRLDSRSILLPPAHGAHILVHVPGWRCLA